MKRPPVLRGLAVVLNSLDTEKPFVDSEPEQGFITLELKSLIRWLARQPGGDP